MKIYMRNEGMSVGRMKGTIAIAAIMVFLISAGIITPVSAQTEFSRSFQLTLIFADEFFKLKKEGNDNKR